jgi:hypothetical protein
MVYKATYEIIQYHANPDPELRALDKSDWATEGLFIHVTSAYVSDCDPMDDFDDQFVPGDRPNYLVYIHHVKYGRDIQIRKGGTWHNTPRAGQLYSDNESLQSLFPNRPKAACMLNGQAIELDHGLILPDEMDLEEWGKEAIIKLQGWLDANPELAADVVDECDTWVTGRRGPQGTAGAA